MMAWNFTSEWSAMDLSNKPLDRWLAAEPLESRWLLSGGASPQFPGDQVGRSGPLAVLEYEWAEEEPDEDVEVDADELPAAVLDAFNAAFPDAEISDAAREIDDGLVEYDVNAEVAGHEIDVSLSPDGRILEVAETLDLEDVPEQALAALRQQFGEAAIEDVSAIDEGGTITLEIAFTTAGGQQAIEATVGDAVVLASVTPPAEATAGVFSDARAAAAAGADELRAAPVARAASDAAQPAAPVDAPQETPSKPQGHAAAAQPALAAAIIDALSNPAAQALHALASGAGASVWLPQAADVIDDLAAIDVAAVERKIQGLLGEIESATTKAATDAAAAAAAAGSHTLPAAAVAAAMLAAAQFVIIRLRLPKGGPILLFNSINSNWSWILGSGQWWSSSSERRRE
jgi:hypothetical protein